MRRTAWLACLSCLCAAPASAEQVVPRPYRVRWAVDGPVIGALTLAWAVPRSLQSRFIDPSCPCDGGEVGNSLDRPFAGLRSEGFDLASNVTWGLVIAGSLGADWLDAQHSGAGWSGFADDFAIISEALLSAGVVYQATALLFQRPRPMLYGRTADDESLQDPANYLSFFSGHSATAFAVSLAFASTYARRHPDDPRRWLVWTAAVAGASVAASLRVAAGRHFPTDAIVGSAVGSVIGLTVPLLHARAPAGALVAVPTPGGLLVAVTVSWR